MMQAEHCACMLRCISCGDAQRRTGAALHRFRMLRLRPWLELVGYSTSVAFSVSARITGNSD